MSMVQTSTTLVLCPCKQPSDSDVNTCSALGSSVGAGPSVDVGSGVAVGPGAKHSTSRSTTTSSCVPPFWPSTTLSAKTLTP